jgi:hypothetical protein
MSDCVGEEEGDFVVAWGVAGTLVWIFSGEGGGGFRAAAGRKGFEPLA